MGTTRTFKREFKLEAVNLVRVRGVNVVQASRDLGINANVLRKWVRDATLDPVEAFPGHRQMKPEQAEITRPKQEVARLRMERDSLKKPRPISPRNRYEVRVRGEAPNCRYNMEIQPPVQFKALVPRLPVAAARCQPWPEATLRTANHGLRVEHLTRILAVDAR